jgi:hypothetical protein
LHSAIFVLTGVAHGFGFLRVRQCENQNANDLLWISFPLAPNVGHRRFSPNQSEERLDSGSHTQLLHIDEVSIFERLITIGMAREDQKLSVRAHFF